MLGRVSTTVVNDATQDSAHPRPARPGVLRSAIGALLLLVASAGAAALGGWWWWSWWGPAIKGNIFEPRQHHYQWFPQPTDPGEAHLTRATYEYVVIAFVLALLIGALVALVGRNRPLVALVLAVACGALGAWVMWQVGTSLSPLDPSRWADKAHACTSASHCPSFPGQMSVTGWTPYLTWPLGALLGFLVVMLTLSGQRRLTPPYAASSVGVPPPPPPPPPPTGEPWAVDAPAERS